MQEPNRTSKGSVIFYECLVHKYCNGTYVFYHVVAGMQILGTYSRYCFLS